MTQELLDEMHPGEILLDMRTVTRQTLAKIAPRIRVFQPVDQIILLYKT